MANERVMVEADWEHRAVTEWIELAAGESRTLRAPIGGYVLVRTGTARIEGPHLHAHLEGPAKSPMGGGRVTVHAETDAEVALGSIRTWVGVVIDLDAGYQSALWSVLGFNLGKRLRGADYSNRGVTWNVI